VRRSNAGTPRAVEDTGNTTASAVDSVRRPEIARAGVPMGAGVGREPRAAENADTRRLKVLVSAYACEPGRGSEPGVGWHVVVEAARHHEVWAITRANNRSVIEADLARNPIPNLHLVYYDLPRWARWWKRGARGTRLYYYLWQLALYPVARREHRRIGFDLAHHVTFVKYWMPSLLPFLPVPFLWGPYRAHLECLARSLGIEDKVHFWGFLPRREALAKLGLCDMLVHPSLHDSGGWVCLEAMAAGKPVICLDLGGPGAQVTSDTGFKVPARDPDGAVKDMAEGMAVLAKDPGLRARMGQAGKDRVASNYAWERKGEFLAALYEELARTAQCRVPRT
jgi:hypothetical protein